MKLLIKTEHCVSFRVHAFISREGGMDEETFGDPKDSIVEAIAVLEQARSVHPDTPWVLLCNVETRRSGG